jgi:hypothetical protein
VTPIFGCTNSQELVIHHDNLYEWYIDHDIAEVVIDRFPPFEYYPTNNSRIFFAATGNVWKKTYQIDEATGQEYEVPSEPVSYKRWRPADWKLPPQPDIIATPEMKHGLFGFTRSWWYDGYQDNLPYIHFTNLVQLARVERNWTNYYYAVRDAVPTPACPRVWQDSFQDIVNLMLYSTQAQFDFMLNDPLFPAEMRDRQESLKTGKYEPDD